MAFNEYMNRNSKVVIGAVASILLLVVGLTVYSVTGNGSARPTKAFFTDDDGKTLFEGSNTLYPPFDHNGKMAVRAHVFTTDGGKTRFVGYLQRYTAEAITKLRAADANRAAGKNDPLTVDAPEIMLRGLEVKRPGDPKWIAANDMAGRNRVMTIPTPNGGIVDDVTP